MRPARAVEQNDSSAVVGRLTAFFPLARFAAGRFFVVILFKVQLPEINQRP
jgi:hypothetical protein